MGFKYKVSVIIPVYNAEEYLEECLDSIVEQTVCKEDIEVLLINDGSVDGSGEICERYVKEYPYMKHFYKENTGVSATRNMGIRLSQGKYMLFLDSDDKYTKNSVEEIVNFFDGVYDEVDLVTCFIQPYKDGKMLKTHSRYESDLKTSGVYDLEKNPYVIQTTMNICVKNLGKENNVYFNEQMKRQEDQEYINRVLERKFKLGYCSKATYLYNRNNESSSVANHFYAYYLFEDTMKYFEELFARYEGDVPKYIQAIFFHDLRWKLTSRILYPFHYDDEKFEEAVNRIKALLARVDVSTIVKNPSINKKHIHYWLRMKPNINPVAFVTKDKIRVMVDGYTVETSTKTSVRLVKFEQTNEGKFRLRGVIESAIYNYIDEVPELYVVENSRTEKKLELFPSRYGYVATNIPTNKAYAFDYLIDPEKVKSFSLRCVVEGITHDVKMNFMGQAVFKHKDRIYSFARNNFIISYNSDTVHFEKKTKEEIYDFEKSQVLAHIKNSIIAELKNNAIDYRYNHRVWLYFDSNTVDKDNGYYQFINDFGKNDGIDRYYVYGKPLEEIEHLFTEEQKEYLVEFGSSLHKLLYLSSEIIVTSFFGRESISPFPTEGEEFDYYDIEHFRIIYMQHGVLHANYVIKYSAENARCDKVVVSTNFEIENLTSKYAYRDEDLIKCGMPRYEHIDRNAKAKNRVLMAPSWRSYFAKNVTPTTYHINSGGFCSTDYYLNFQKFLNDERLIRTLEEKDIYLDVKMHPIINGIVSDLFVTKSDRINFVSEIKLEDYKLFITDFSSFVFDYAYLGRPIMYFVPDYDQFRSGMNLYRELDLPFEEAFGPLSTDSDTAVEDFIGICNRDFVAEDIYQERMDNFYLPMENCCEGIYNYIYNEMF